MKGKSTSQLFKFMNSQIAILVLKNLSIRFTQPSKLNDPYECHLTIDKNARKLLKEYFLNDYKKIFP
jgi:hypothetical protein